MTEVRPSVGQKKKLPSFMIRQSFVVVVDTVVAVVGAFVSIAVIVTVFVVVYVVATCYCCFSAVAPILLNQNLNSC